MTAFWRNWLTIWCWAVGLFGVALIAGAFPATGAGDAMFALLGQPDALYTGHLRFSLALMGAVTLGWALTFHAAFAAAHALGDKAAPVWRGLAIAMLVWYVVDSALSVATGFPLNAASNTVLAIAFLIPVLRSGVLAAR